MKKKTYSHKDVFFTIMLIALICLTVNAIADECAPGTHNLVEVITLKPTCSSEGKAITRCTVCGYVVASSERSVPMLSHDYTWVTDTAPQCQIKGREHQVCKVCDSIGDYRETAPLGHNWGPWTATKAPTCETTGEDVRVCANDPSHRETREVPALEHIEVIDEAIAPTCIETGLTEGKHCALCGLVFIAQSIIPIGEHQYMYCPASEPTCTDNGCGEGFKCSVCGKIEVGCDVIPAIGHISVIDGAVEPSCIQEGLTQGSHCSVCGTILEAQEAIPKIPHQNVLDASVAPTCTTEGLTAGFHCQVCETVFVEQQSVPALGHQWDEATYSWNKNQHSVTASHVCTRNEHHKETETVNADAAIIISPTMENEGKAILTSAAFENELFTVQTEEIIIPALGSLQLLNLPQNMLVIEEEGLANLGCEAIIIPHGCTTIGSRAFANCSNLMYIFIPSTVIFVADDAFEGCNQVVIDRIQE